jgi:hypothetical protein
MRAALIAQLDKILITSTSQTKGSFDNLFWDQVLPSLQGGDAAHPSLAAGRDPGELSWSGNFCRHS